MSVSRALFNALHMVESGGKDNPPDGDGGRAIGPYQIWEPYYKDAVEFNKPLRDKGTYQDCRKKDYAEEVIQSYMNRYATKGRLGHEPTDEDIARIHNGGPNGYKKEGLDSKKLENLDKYWKKVKAELK